MLLSILTSCVTVELADVISKDSDLYDAKDKNKVDIAVDDNDKKDTKSPDSKEK